MSTILGLALIIFSIYFLGQDILFTSTIYYRTHLRSLELWAIFNSHRLWKHKAKVTEYLSV